MDVNSNADLVGEFGCAGSIFSMRLLGFINKAIKLFLPKLVNQCRNMLPLALTVLASLRRSTQKRMRAIYPALTSHSVNKAIILDPCILM